MQHVDRLSPTALNRYISIYSHHYDIWDLIHIQEQIFWYPNITQASSLQKCRNPKPLPWDFKDSPRKGDFVFLGFVPHLLFQTLFLALINPLKRPQPSPTVPAPLPKPLYPSQDKDPPAFPKAPATSGHFVKQTFILKVCGEESQGVGCSREQECVES